MKDKILQVVIACLFFAAFYMLFESNDENSGLDAESLAQELADSGFSMQSPAASELTMSTRKIVITTGVNANFSRYLIEQLFLLNSISPEEPIDLYIRTDGGWECDAFAIIDVIRCIEAPVNIHAMGEVHSAGCMILIATTGERTVYPHTILGFHTLDEGEDELFADRYTKLWRDYADIPSEWLERTDNEMIYFSAEDALKYDVVDVLKTHVTATDVSKGQ